MKTDSERQSENGAATADSGAKPEGGHRRRLRTTGLMLGRGLATFVVVSGIGILGVRHYHQRARAKQDGDGVAPVAMEPARLAAGLGSQRMTVDGLDLNITRSWEVGPPEMVKSRLTQRNRSLGWEALAGAPASLPHGLRARPEFQFLCFLTANHRMVGYGLNPDGHGTRITATELDLRQVIRKATGEKPVPVPPDYADLMPRPPQFSLAGGDPAAGSELYLVKVPAADAAVIAADLRGRFLRHGWKLEPWDAVTGKDGLFPVAGEWFVAHRDQTLCHLMVVQEDNEVLASYRFSRARPARVGAVQPGSP